MKLEFRDVLKEYIEFISIIDDVCDCDIALRGGKCVLLVDGIHLLPNGIRVRVTADDDYIVVRGPRNEDHAYLRNGVVYNISDGMLYTVRGDIKSYAENAKKCGRKAIDGSYYYDPKALEHDPAFELIAIQKTKIAKLEKELEHYRKLNKELEDKLRKIKSICK